MATPIFDEGEIIAMLSAPVGPYAVSRLQHGAVQALVDLYDRKCTRDEFVRMASPVIALYASTAKLWLIKNVEEIYNDGDLDADRLNQANVGLCDLIRKQSEEVIDMVKRLQMCPTDQDTVN
jgi:hypothetical protein